MKTLKILAILIVAVCGTLTLASCTDEKVTQIVNITGSYKGQVSITNLTTNELITDDIATAIVTVNGAITNALNVKNGDKVRVQYTLDNYKEYPPTVTVSVGDASPVQLTSDSYEFVVSGMTTGAVQKVTCKFSYSKSTDEEKITLGGIASFNLTMAED